MRNIYPYKQARQMYNTTNGAGFKDAMDTTKAFLRQPMSDTLTVDHTAGLKNLSFFTGAVGNLFKTNMSLSGQFPNGQDFLAWNLQLYFQPGVLNSPAIATTAVQAQYVNDVAAFYGAGSIAGQNNATATINILSAPWLKAPVNMLPPANRLVGSVAVGVANDTASTINIANNAIASWGGEVFDLNGLWLPSNTNFEVAVALNLAGGLPSGVDGTLTAVLDGVLYRNTQ